MPLRFPERNPPEKGTHANVAERGPLEKLFLLFSLKPKIHSEGLEMVKPILIVSGSSNHGVDSKPSPLGLRILRQAVQESGRQGTFARSSGQGIHLPPKIMAIDDAGRQDYVGFRESGSLYSFGLVCSF